MIVCKPPGQPTISSVLSFFKKHSPSHWIINSFRYSCSYDSTFLQCSCCFYLYIFKGSLSSLSVPDGTNLKALDLSDSKAFKCDSVLDQIVNMTYLFCEVCSENICIFFQIFASFFFSFFMELHSCLSCHLSLLFVSFVNFLGYCLCIETSNYAII